MIRGVLGRLHFGGFMASVEPAANELSLGDCSQQAVRRYLSRLEGHPAAQLHRLVMAEVEKPLLIEVLKHCLGNLTHASEMLGLNRATLRKKLNDFGIAY